MNPSKIGMRIAALPLLLLLTKAAHAQPQEIWLPSASAVQAALEASPAVAAARARQQGLSARAEGIRTGSAEFVVKATGQQRRVREPYERFPEGQLAIERPLRLWGKADADAALAEATGDQGAILLDDARHETSKLMLALWFNALRAGQATAAMSMSADLARELVAATDKRVLAGDAARMDLDIARAEEARAVATLATTRIAQDAAEAELRARFPALGLPQGLQGLADLSSSPAALLDSAARRRFLQTNHGLRLASADETIAKRSARRVDLERKPDPTVGAFYLVERGGSERIAGLAVSMPLGSGYRRAAADAAAADAEAAAHRRATLMQTAGAEFDVLARTATGLEQAARAQQSALTLVQSAAARAGRAYAAGELDIGQLLVVRRGLADSTLAMHLAVINALEAQQKLRLELHEASRFETEEKETK